MRQHLLPFSSGKITTFFNSKHISQFFFEKYFYNIYFIDYQLFKIQIIFYLKKSSKFGMVQIYFIYLQP